MTPMIVRFVHIYIIREGISGGPREGGGEGEREKERGREKDGS